MRQICSGFVLVPLLWVLIFVGALASAALHFTRDASSSLQATIDRLRLEDVTRSAIAFALAAADARNQMMQGRVQMRLPNATATITWTSEAARVDLNLAAPELLRALFLAVGAEAADAQDYTGRIMQRRDSVRAGGAALALAFSHPAEIGTLGLPTGIALRLREFATVYGATGAIDPRIAPPALVSSLPGMTEILRRDLASASDPQLASIKSREAGGAGAWIEAAPGRALRLIVEAHLGTRHHARSDIVLVRFFDDGEPYRILYWQAAPAGDSFADMRR
jgi:general secretion pathway protein K